MFGASDPNTGTNSAPQRELVRLAVPRRVYTGSHLEYVADVMADIVRQRERLNGYRIVKEPTYLRHFTCIMEEMMGYPAGAVVD